MKEKVNLMDVQKLIEKAEQIMSVVRDPSLKPVAFGNILDILLHGEQTPKGKTKGTTKSLEPGAKKEKGKEGPMKWLKELKEEDFFDTLKNTQEMLTALAESGHHLKRTDLTFPLQECVKDKILRRKKQAPGKGGKPVWHYSNW